MGYQSRARNFSFMGVDALRRTVEVVPSKEDFPVLLRRPDGSPAVTDGTTSMRASDFVAERRRNRIGFLSPSGKWL